MERGKSFSALALLLVVVGYISCQSYQQPSGNLRRFPGALNKQQQQQQQRQRHAGPPNLLGPRPPQQQRRFQGNPTQFQNQRVDFGGPPIRTYPAPQKGNQESAFIYPVQSLASVQLLESRAQLVPAILGSLTRHREVLHAGGRVFDLEEAESEEEQDSTPDDSPVSQVQDFSSGHVIIESPGDQPTILTEIKKELNSNQESAFAQPLYLQNSGGSLKAPTPETASKSKDDTSRAFDMEDDRSEEERIPVLEDSVKPMVIHQEPRDTVSEDDSLREKQNTTSEEVEDEDLVLPSSTVEPAWKLFPLLLPPTPPGKPINSKFQAYAYVAGAQRQNSTLSAASMYAKLQPELKERYKDGLKQTQRTPLKPYRRRPVRPTTTEFAILNRTEGVEGVDLMLVQKPSDQETNNHPNLKDDIQIDEDDKLEDVQLEDPEEETASGETGSSEKENQTTRKSDTRESGATQAHTISSSNKTESEKVNEGSRKAPVDIKGLLKSAESHSLSELLQKKGLSLSDLLKGGPTLLQELRSSATTVSEARTRKNEPNDQLDSSTSTIEPQATTTTSSITTTTTTTSTISSPVTTQDIPSLPQVVPIKLSQLLRARNQTLSDIIEAPSGESKSTSVEPLVFKASAAPTTVTMGTTTHAVKPADEPHSEERQDMSLETISELGGAAAVTTTVSTSASLSSNTTAPSTTSTAKSRRPYIPQGSVGEYNSRLTFDDDEDSKTSNSSTSTIQKATQFGGNRPIAVSRLTPAPPRSQRPKYVYNWNTTSESVVSRMENSDGDERGSTTTEEPTTIKVRFTAKDLRENEHTSEVVPITMKNVIIASSVIGGFCVLVFLAILVVFRIKQKARIRLRHSALFFGKARRVQAMGSDGSGTLTPVANTRSGYAKLAYRNSLWGTLRKTLRNVDS